MFALAASVDAIEKEHGVPTELDAAASDVAREQRLAAFARLPGLRHRALAFMVVEYAFFIGYAALTAFVPPEAWVKARSSSKAALKQPKPRFSKAKAMERLMGPWIMAAMCAALDRGWRGADRRNILDFRRHFPDAQVVKLEQNYRSTQRILRAANAVVSRNVDRESKRLWTENGSNGYKKRHFWQGEFIWGREKRRRE